MNSAHDRDNNGFCRYSSYDDDDDDDDDNNNNNKTKFYFNTIKSRMYIYVNS